MNIFVIIGVVVVLAVVAGYFVYEKKALAEAARYYPRHPELRALQLHQVGIDERPPGS
jgi:hypothetical protein